MVKIRMITGFVLMSIFLFISVGCNEQNNDVHGDNVPKTGIPILIKKSSISLAVWKGKLSASGKEVTIEVTPEQQSKIQSDGCNLSIYSSIQNKVHEDTVITTKTGQDKVHEDTVITTKTGQDKIHEDTVITAGTGQNKVHEDTVITAETGQNKVYENTIIKNISDVRDTETGKICDVFITLDSDEVIDKNSKIQVMLSKKKVIALSNAFIKEDEKGKFVWKVENTFEIPDKGGQTKTERVAEKLINPKKVYIELGETGPNTVEVKKGLSEGDIIAKPAE